MLYDPWFFRALLSHLSGKANIHANHLHDWIKKALSIIGPQDRSPIQMLNKIGEYYIPGKVLKIRKNFASNNSFYK